MKKIQTIILVVAVILIVIIALMFFGGKSEEEVQLDEKMKEIDETFKIWIEIVTQKDKEFLMQNEKDIKLDLATKLNKNELVSLKDYSSALKDLLSVKNTPLSTLFITSTAYLVSNFNSVKQIVSKTTIKDWFNRIGFSNLPNQKQA